MARLGGLSGGLGGLVASPIAGTQAPVVFGPGLWTFKATVSGLYTFRLWGGGGCACLGGDGYFFPGASAGAYSRKTVRLAAGQSVPVSVGQGGFQVPTGSAVVDAKPGDTTVSLPGNLVVTAGAGKNADRNTYNGTPPPLAGGIASGGDVNRNGGASGSVGDGAFAGVPGASVPNAPGGGSAPGDEVMTGGNGGAGRSDAYINNGISPGGAGGASYKDNNGGGQIASRGGDGLAIVTFEGA